MSAAGERPGALARTHDPELDGQPLNGRGLVVALERIDAGQLMPVAAAERWARELLAAAAASRAHQGGTFSAAAAPVVLTAGEWADVLALLGWLDAWTRRARERCARDSDAWAGHVDRLNRIDLRGGEIRRQLDALRSEWEGARA